MTESELLLLLSQKTPDQLSAIELEAIRQQLAASPQLHRQLVQEHGLDLYLAQALGPQYASAPLEAPPLQAAMSATSPPPLPASAASGAATPIPPPLPLPPRVIAQAVAQALTSSPAHRPAAYRNWLLPLAIFGGLAVLGLLVGSFLGGRRTGKPDPSVAANANHPPGDRSEETAEAPAAPADAAEKAALNQVAFVILIPADKFVAGNVEIDRSQWGNKDTVIVRSTTQAAHFVDYSFQAPRSAEIELRLRYASFESRPFRLLLDGRLITGQAGGEPSNGWFPDSQKWFTVARFSLPHGDHKLRLERGGPFPHLNQIALAEVGPFVAANVPGGAVAPAGGPAAKPTVAPGNPSDIASEKTAPAGVAAVVKPASPAASAQPAAVSGGAKSAAAGAANDKTSSRPAGPWDEVLDAPGSAPTFAQTAYGDFDPSQSLTQPDELKQWLTAAPGQPLNLGMVQERLGRAASFQGVAKLRAPWTNDTALRLSLERYQQFKLHCFTGERGVTFSYLENRNMQWLAYTTHRKPGAAVPETLELCGEDSGRFRRSEMRYGGPFDIRYRDGELILCRGPLAILRAPLPAPPSEVFLDGQAVFYGIALVRSSGGPPRSEPAPAALDTAKPAALAWTSETPAGQKFEKREDGSVQLASDGTPQTRAIAAVPLPNFGPSEIIMQLADVTSGTGVFLGHGGKPNLILRFAKDPRSDQLVADLRGEEEMATANAQYWRDGAFAGCSTSPWVRIVISGGYQRYTISPDGIHWGDAFPPTVPIPGPVTHLGLFSPTNKNPGKIRLVRLVVRPLAGLTSAVPPPLLEKAPEITTAASPEQWLAAANQALPPAADANLWRQACALKALGRGCPPLLAQHLLEALLDDSLPGRTLEVQLARLDAAARLVDVWGDLPRLSRFVTRYRNAALAAPAGERLAAFRLARDHLLDAELATQQTFPAVDETLLRQILIEMVHQGDDEEVLRLVRELRFFHQHQDRPVVDWAEAVARARLGAPAAPTPRGSPPPRPISLSVLAEENNKNSYRSLAELQALIDAKAWDDASRMLSSLDALSRAGLAQEIHDRQHWVSLATGVRSAVREHPELASALRKNFAQIGALRVEQAIAESNAPAVRLATLQFDKTEAASRAHLWLGDRALASGRFSEAIVEYAALASDDPLAAQAAPRRRLAAALLGRSEGQPQTQPLRLGDVNFAPAEFERLLDELRQKAASSGLAPARQGTVVASLAESGLEPGRKIALEGEIGDAPNEVPWPFNQPQVRWQERQLAVTVDGSLALFSNRFQVAAYDLASGKEKWRAQPPPGARVKALAWPLVSMTPVVSGPLIFARLMHERAPILVCLEKETGKLQWTYLPGKGTSVASDPVVSGDRVYALLISEAERKTRRLKLASFDPKTGDILETNDWLHLTDTWDQRHTCAIASQGQLLVASLGGAVIGGELSSGQVRWVRQQTLLPHDADRTQVYQDASPPLIRGDRVYLAAPGVRAVEALDLETGALRWRSVLPTIRRMAGVTGKALLVETDDQLLALRLDDGQRMWTCELPEFRTSAVLVDERDTAIFVHAPRTGQGNARRPTVVWLGALDGKRRAAAPLAALTSDDPALNLVFTHQGKWFATYAKTSTDPKRELLELAPKGDPQRPAPGMSLSKE